MQALIVADASPLIALYDGGCLEVLHLAFDEIIIPERVFHEVFSNRFRRVKPKWIKIRAITVATSLHRREEFLNTYFLDAGESEAIALAQELNVEVLLDERNARGICRELGVRHRSAYEVCAELLRLQLISKKQFSKVAEALRLHGGFTPGDGDQIEIA